MDFPEIGFGWIVVIFVAAAICLYRRNRTPIGPNAAKRVRNQTHCRAASKRDSSGGGDGGFDSDSDGSGD